MRRVVTITETRCDLCSRELSSTPGSWFRVGPLDFCRRCREPRRACESCGSLPALRLQQTWAGNCLDCWRLAMSLPRGKCSAKGIGWAGCGRAHPTDIRHSCDQLAEHPDAHHCPDCGANWGLR